MAETRSPTLLVSLFVAAVAVVALAGGFGGSQTTQPSETFEFVVEDHSVGEGVVVELNERGGFELFGLVINQPDRFVRVAFTLPNHCDVDDTQNWPSGQSGCAGPEGLAGTIAGSGITAGGGPIVLVEATIDVACLDTVELGTKWPPAACAA